jgi:pyridinium-3,5-bisthiocarboxylic acid mononucleotide nickel chelatase
LTKVAYLDCIGGLAGDMLLGALLDAGASQDILRSLPDRLDLQGTRIEVERVQRSGIGAVHVQISDGAGHEHRNPAALQQLLAAADLSDAVRQQALDVVARLAEVEARIHGIPVDEVHFHELGAVDTIVDIVGALALLEDLDVRRVACSALPFSRALVRAAHGVLPSPAPATLALLEGAPLVGVEVEAELVTPTGAALAAVLVDEWGPLPPLRLDAVGYGAGSMELADRPNIVRVVVGVESSVRMRDVVLVETNLDDLSPELVPDAVERCFTAGALDVWTIPAQMKKGRPGIVLSALTRPGAELELARAMLEETSALGVRFSQLSRFELERDERTVDVAGHAVRVKVGILDGRVVNLAPEHDDCAAVARSTGRSVKSIWIDALARTREL